MSDDFPWEPPFAGTEAEHVLGSLDRLRTTFRWKAADLDAAGLQTRIGASTLTLGGRQRRELLGVPLRVAGAVDQPGAPGVDRLQSPQRPGDARRHAVQRCV